MIHTTELTSPSSAALQWIKYYLKRNTSKCKFLTVEIKLPPMYGWTGVGCGVKVTVSVTRDL